MAISKAALEAITAATSPVSSFEAVLDALVQDQSITAAAAATVKASLKAHATELNPAILAHTDVKAHA